MIPILAAFIAMPGYAQEPAEGVFRSDTRLVLLHATIVDNKGHLVTNLPKDAFTVLEDGKPQPLRIFRREDVPVSLGLIIDSSGSIRANQKKVAAAALGLVKASNSDDEVFIVSFNDQPTLEVPFTNNISVMEKGLQDIPAQGGTAMRDAILMSMDYLKQKAKRDKKILLVITDGDDNMSEITNTIEKLSARAQQGEVLIYAIGLLNDEDRGRARNAKRAITTLTMATGGLAYFPETADEVEQLALQVAHEIRNQYILAYSPTLQRLDGSYRRVRVLAKGPNRPEVRTRAGYYATPDERPKN